MRYVIFFLLVLAAFVLLWVTSEGIAVWNRLPERIPTHFGAGGEADAWGTKSIFSVFGGLIISAVILIAMALASRLSPKWYNLPGRERVLRLPPQQRDHVMSPIREGLAWLAAAISIAFSLVARQTWAVALGRQETLSPWTIIIPLVIGAAAIAIGIVYSHRRIRELAEQH